MRAAFHEPIQELAHLEELFDNAHLLRKLFGVASRFVLPSQPTMGLSLIEQGTRLCERSMLLIETSEALLRECEDHLARARFVLQQHTKRRASGSLLPVIRLKLHDGRLPYDGAPKIVGHPGGGGQCAACGKALLKRQLVMDIPSSDGQFAYLHAGCYMLWNAGRHKDRTRQAC